MRYLKTYNERLKSWTYDYAAKKLGEIGHTKRSQRMKEWAIEVREKEILNDVKLAQEKNKEFGVFSATVYNAINDRKILSGNFYLEMTVESEVFSDRVYDWLWEYHERNKLTDLSMMLEFALIPADEETYLKMREDSEDLNHLNENWFYNGRYWINYIDVNLYKGFNQKFEVSEFYSKDGIKFIFNSRRDAVKFKKIVVDALEGKTNWSSYKKSDGIATQADCFKSIIYDDNTWNALLGNIEVDTNKDILSYPGDAVNLLTEDVYLNALNAVKNMSVNRYYID